MSIKILTLEEAEETKKACERYGEAYEEKVGRAPCKYICDNSGAPIEKGDMCAAVLILPNRNHHNYEHQLQMLGQYVVS